MVKLLFTFFDLIFISCKLDTHQSSIKPLANIPKVDFYDLPAHEGELMSKNRIYSGYVECWSMHPIEKCDTNLRVGLTQSNVKDTSFYKVIIRSPGRCVHLIVFDSLGNGKLMFGSTEPPDYREEFIGFHFVLKESNFKITSQSDLDSIKNIIKKFIDCEPLKSSRPLDAYRYELFIDESKKVDAYGVHAKILFGLIDILAKYLPFKIDYTCF